MKISPSVFRRLMNGWPPFLGAGIRVQRIAPDWREIDVRMRLRWYNRNYVRSHFGGSLYAMTDPFYMLMLMHNLGRDYIVWDKSAAVEYMAPGKGTVWAHFRLSEDMLDDIRRHTADGDKYLPEFSIDVVGETDEVIARVRRTIYVRLKPRLRSALLESDDA